MCRSRAAWFGHGRLRPFPQPEWPVGEWAEGWVEGVGLGNHVQSGLVGGQVRITHSRAVAGLRAGADGRPRRNGVDLDALGLDFLRLRYDDLQHAVLG